MAERSARFLGCRRKKEEGRRKKEKAIGSRLTQLKLCLLYSPTPLLPNAPFKVCQSSSPVGCVSGSVTHQTLYPREQDI
ncbi:MAG: hypothetical protein F6K39_08510, partial [Okeania sp. SIO3B3]|nr:hypothetical protein [Okeania sp. SIO3B3]